MGEVTGSGFKERVLMVKGNKYCHDLSRVELTAAKRVFFLLRSAACLLSTLLPGKLTGAEFREGNESLAALTGLLHDR